MVMGQTNGKSWEVIGASAPPSSIPKSFRLDYDPSDLFRAGIKNLCDASILMLVMKSGPDGIDIMSIRDHVRHCASKTPFYQGVKRLCELGLILNLGKSKDGPHPNIYVGTKRGLRVIRGEFLPTEIP